MKNCKLECVKKIGSDKRKILCWSSDNQCEKLLEWCGNWLKKLITGKNFNWKIDVKN